MIFKDGLGAKRVLAGVAILFAMVMLTYRLVRMGSEITMGEITIWLGSIATNLGVLGVATVAEKRASNTPAVTMQPYGQPGEPV